MSARSSGSTAAREARGTVRAPSKTSRQTESFGARQSIVDGLWVLGSGKEGFSNIASVTSGAAAGAAERASCAFARFEHVVHVGARDGMRIQRHDRIAERLTLVRLDPRLDIAARAERRRREDCERDLRDGCAGCRL